MPRWHPLYLRSIPYGTKRKSLLGKASLVLTMRITAQLLCVALIICSSPISADSGVPSFKDCQAAVFSSQKPVHVKLSTAESRRYASQLRYAARGSANFAGHYIFASWGCGAGCVMGGAIDARNGSVAMLPFTVSDWPLDVTEPLSFKRDSCLLVIQGSRNEQGHGTYYYKFEGNRFELLKAIAK